MLKKLLSGADQVFTIDCGRFEPVDIEQLFQDPLALGLRQFAKVCAVEPEEVERAMQQTVLVALGEVCLQL
ncbi:hypothetical protein AOQ71_04835 [Bradyrhizobium manausense]|uniref:Uncharacterized protein n=1 Tax=Bradyrhizobium manausense TaxID=989370 RepID=A0A0R3EAS4_9BRAD|nr:hypothetical protein AOQ71_04835 [Bradyrhizobium manausense]